MKQLLFLLLFPCLALAQYQGNANQKITLGEQTTSDGLVWRGRTTDTVNLMTSKLDTSAYLVLDTITEAIWLYRASTTPKWNRVVDSLNNLQGQLSLTTKVTGVLPLGNGGTGSTTQNFVDLTTTQSIGGDKTFTSAVVGANFRPTSSTIPTNGIYLPASNTLGFSTNTTNKMTLDANGNLGIGVSPSPWTNFKAIQLLAGTSFVGFGTQGEFWTNSYFSGGFKYYQNGYATRFACIDGEYDFYTSSNNTSGAGATLTFSQIVKFDRNGNVGIGTTTPQSGYKLHVVDSVYVGGRVSAAGYTTRSDYNLKDEIQTLNYGLNEVIQMQPVKYTYKSNGEQQLGFIAQDIGTLIPESVHFDEFMGVDYQSLIPILTKAIQEQQALIKALEQRILILENK